MGKMWDLAGTKRTTWDRAIPVSRPCPDVAYKLDAYLRGLEAVADAAKALVAEAAPVADWDWPCLQVLADTLDALAAVSGKRDVVDLTCYNPDDNIDVEDAERKESTK